jgi:hypothetical protein
MHHQNIQLVFGDVVLYEFYLVSSHVTCVSVWSGSVNVDNSAFWCVQYSGGCPEKLFEYHVAGVSSVMVAHGYDFLAALDFVDEAFGFFEFCFESVFC